MCANLSNLFEVTDNKNRNKLEISKIDFFINAVISIQSVYAKRVVFLHKLQRCIIYLT